MFLNSEDPLPLLKGMGKTTKRVIITILSVLVAFVALALITTASNNGEDAQATQDVEETVLEAEKIVPIITDEPVESTVSEEELVEEGIVITTTPLDNPSNSTALTWEDNPNSCSDTQWIALEAPHYCIDKPVVDAMANTTIPSEPAVEEDQIVDVNKVVEIADNSTPTVECDLETQWISKEEPQYCIDKPVDNLPVSDPVTAEEPTPVVEEVVVEQVAPVVSTPAPVVNSSVQQMIIDASARYGVSSDYMLRIAFCESGYQGSVVNYNYTAGDGTNPTGVFQFIRSTYTWFAAEAGFPVQDDRLNAYNNINVAVWAFANGYASHWECK